jgi:hypothetical protein
MSFPITRQTKLNPVLAALGKVPGVAKVQQDDFDSNSIVVHIGFGVAQRSHARKVLKFTHRMNVVSRQLRKALKDSGVSYSMAPDVMPDKQYEYVPGCPGCPGIPATRAVTGYDKESISVIVYV